MANINIQDVSIYYEYYENSKNAETLVFLNGVMASVNSWALQKDFFIQQGFNVLLHDFRGQLKSDKPKNTYSFKQHADDLKVLLEYLKISKAHLIGTSYGGEVALKMGIVHPSFVESLCIIDSVSELDEMLIHFVKHWKSLALTYQGELFFRGLLPSLYSPSYLKTNAELLENRALGFKEMPRAYFDGQMMLYDCFLNDVTMTDELSKISARTLIICGTEDILKPVKFSKIIAQNIQNSNLILIPDCGHVMILEKPEILNFTVLGFVSSQQP